MEDVQRRWDLWNLKTLFPRWGADELDSLLRTGAAQDAWQQALFAQPKEAARKFAPQARRVMTNHPDLATGLTISLHLGPYSLAPVPWLVAGHDVHVLVNRSSLAEIRPIYDSLQAVLNLPGQVRWVPIEGRGFALKMLRALRKQEAVFAFLDGNDGLDGCEGTLQDGVEHQLPGRSIRVRTGLARLALSVRCPVHSLHTVWDEKGSFSWERGPTWRWPRGTTATAATGDLFEWGFGVIARHPAQWRAWNMLTGVCEGFRDQEPPDVAQGEDFWEVASLENRNLLLHWRRPATVWPGDMLEDVTGNCFYAAAGLRPTELATLQEWAHFSPASVAQKFGVPWLESHLPRLLALGFIGRAAASSSEGAGNVRNPS